MLTNIHSLKTSKVFYEKENHDFLQRKESIHHFQPCEEYQEQHSMTKTRSLEKKRKGITRTISANKTNGGTRTKGPKQEPSSLQKILKRSQYRIGKEPQRKDQDMGQNKGQNQNRSQIYPTGQKTLPLKFPVDQQDDQHYNIKVSYHSKTSKISPIHNSHQIAKQLENCHEKIQLLEQELVVYEKQKIELQNFLQYAESENQHQRNEIEQLKDKLNLQRSRRQLIQFGTKISPQITEKADEKPDSNEMLLAEIQVLLRQNQLLIRKFNDQTHEAAQLQNQQLQLKNKLNQSFDQREKMAQIISELERKLENEFKVHELISQYDQKLSKRKQMESKLLRQIEELKLKNESSSRITQMQHSDVEFEFQRLKRNHEFVESELEAQRKKVQKMELEIQQARAGFNRRIRQRQQEIFQQENTIKQLQDQIRTFKQGNSNSLLKYQTSKSLILGQNLQQQGALEHLKKQLQEISLKKQQFRVQNTFLKDQIQRLKLQIQQLSSDLQSSTVGINYQKRDYGQQLQYLTRDNQNLNAQNQKLKLFLQQIEWQKTKQVTSLSEELQQVRKQRSYQRLQLQDQYNRKLAELQQAYTQNKSVIALEAQSSIAQLEQRNRFHQLQIKNIRETAEIKKIAMQKEYEKIIYNQKQQILSIEEERLKLVQALQKQRLSNSSRRRRSLSRSPPKYLPTDQDPSALKRQIEYLQNELAESKTKIKDLISKLNNHIFEREKNQQEIKEGKRKIKHIEEELKFLKEDKQKFYNERVNAFEQISLKEQKNLETQQLVKSLEQQIQSRERRLRELMEIETMCQAKIGENKCLIQKIEEYGALLESCRTDSLGFEQRYKSLLNSHQNAKMQISSMETEIGKYKQLVIILKKEKEVLSFHKSYGEQNDLQTFNSPGQKISRQKIYQELSRIKSEWFSISFQQGQSQFEFLAILLKKIELLCSHTDKCMLEQLETKKRLSIYQEVVRKFQQLKLDYDVLYEKYSKYKEIARLEKQKAKEGHRMTENIRKYNGTILDHCHQLIRGTF